MYPHVATGFSDSNAYLRELTLKSMLVLAPKLSQKTLTQSFLKFLAKLQVSLTLAMPKIGSWWRQGHRKHCLSLAFKQPLHLLCLLFSRL